MSIFDFLKKEKVKKKEKKPEEICPQCPKLVDYLNKEIEERESIEVCYESCGKEMNYNEKLIHIIPQGFNMGKNIFSFQLVHWNSIDLQGNRYYVKWIKDKKGNLIYENKENNAK